MTEYSQKIRVNRVPEPTVRVRVKPRVPPLELELQNTGTEIQWRLGTTGVWQDLVDVSDLTGPPGANGLIVSVGAGTGIAVDITVPSAPVVSVSTAVMLKSENFAGLTDVALARATIAVPVVVSSRTDLKALATTKDTLAVLTESGRQGTFVWMAGNYSTQVTADTLEGIYIKATAIASSAGAWVRIYADAILVDWFGAVGDATTNDAPAIQAAINTGARRVVFGAKRYRITTPLNLTAKVGGGIMLKGAGRGEGSVGSQIIGETSGLMIDATGSQYVELVDLTLKSGTTNKSTGGVLFARATTAQYAQFCSLTRVLIDIATNTAANGGKGTFGVYNYAAELFVMTDSYFRADTPCVVTANNVFSITSTFVTVESGTWSTSHIESYGCSFVSYAFAAVRLAGTMSRIHFDHMYALRSTGTYKYAIQIDGLTDGATFDGNLEGFERAVYVSYTLTQCSFKFRIPGTNAESLIYLDGVPGFVPGLRASVVDIFAWNVTTQNVIEQTATGQNGSSGNEIYLHGSQTLAIGGGYSTANLIKAGTNASPSVALSGAGFFSGILMARDWQRLLGTTYGERLLVDHPSGGVGYATGAGGTITQATSKSTGVTLSKASGQITMNAAALAAATIVSFVLTNTAIAAGDVLILNHISGGTVGAYTLNAQCAAGSATINVRNNTGGSLSEAVVIGYALIKAVTA